MFGATKMDGKKTANGRAGHTIVTAPNVVQGCLIWKSV